MTVTATELDFGLFLIRATAGLLMAAHGAQKLFGWFGGSSMTQWAADLERMGIRPAVAWAYISVGAQSLGGLLLAAGLLTPFATVSLVGPMTVVVVQKWSKGFFNVRGGYEFMLLLLLIGVALAFSGPGAISVDEAIGFGLSLELRLAIVAATIVAALVAVLPARSAVPAQR
jgi:putative oxidoreductase